MITWKLSNGLLSLDIEGHSFNLTGKEIISLEMGSKIEINGLDVPCVSSQIKSIDFSCADFLSTVYAVIYTPISKNDLLPFCQFVIEDSYFQRHEVPFLVSDYIVVDNLFLIVDSKQAGDLKKSFESYASGSIGYRQVATIQKESNEYVSFEESEKRCIEKANLNIEKSNTRNILYDYQVQGVEWMNTVISENVGFVLADEMGLGKTVQIITIIDEQRNNGPSLLICPNSLMENWAREIRKFSPSISFFIDSGKNRQHDYRKIQRYNLVITSYDVARNDFAVFCSVDWNLIILDEAQNIKNYGTQKSKEIKKFPKRCGIAVTGTPLENHLTDIWSIYDFCFTGLLGSTVSEFKKEFNDSSICAERIEKVVSPLMLRRYVCDVRKDLPDKVIIPVALEMNFHEAEEYEAIRTSGEKNGSNLGILQKLRSYCAMPECVKNDDFFSPMKNSAKFAYLFECLLDGIFSKKEKVLIFTESIEAQKRIQENLHSRYGAYCELLNGSVPVESRQPLIDEFSSKDGFATLIINPTVGSSGLNITAANHVIFYTLDWNPATEDQCIARSARIGQTRTVFVYRLYYVGTVEDEVNNCLERKRVMQEKAIKGTTPDIYPDIGSALARSPFYDSHCL